MIYQKLPPLNALKALDAVARHGSFSAAARSLNVSQGAVSRHIANLEDFLGCSLFERGKAGADLTEQGQNFVDQVSPALASILKATIECRTMTDAVRALQISTSSSFAVKWLAPRLQGFQKVSPGATVNLTVSDTCPDFSAGTCDLAVVPAAKKTAPANSRHLFDEVLVPVCSPAYARRFALKVPADVMRCQLIQTTTRPDIWDGWMQTYCAEDQNLRTKTNEFGFQDFYLSVEAALSGTGVALVPQFLVAENLDNGGLIAPVGCPYRSGHAYWLVTKPRPTEHGPLDAFMHWLQSQISGIGKIEHTGN